MDITARVETKALESMTVYIRFQILEIILNWLEKIYAGQLENDVSLYKLYDTGQVDQRNNSRIWKQSYLLSLSNYFFLFESISATSKQAVKV